MNLVTLLFSALASLLICAFSVLLMAAIVFNLRAARGYRRRLAQEFHQLRLSRMLSALGLDIERYLHEERVLDIYRQMHRCSACERTADCDEALSSGAVTGERMGFCANQETLRKLLHREDRLQAQPRRVGNAS